MINPAHSGLRMLLRPGTGALRPKSSQPASKLGYCNAKEETANPFTIGDWRFRICKSEPTDVGGYGNSN